MSGHNTNCGIANRKLRKSVVRKMVVRTTVGRLQQGLEDRRGLRDQRALKGRRAPVGRRVLKGQRGTKGHRELLVRISEALGRTSTFQRSTKVCSDSIYRR